MIFESFEIQEAKELTERCHKFAGMNSTMSQVCPTMNKYGICHCQFVKSCDEITETDWLAEIAKRFYLEFSN